MKAAEHVCSDNCYKYGIHQHIGDESVRGGCYSGVGEIKYVPCGVEGGRIDIIPNGLFKDSAYTQKAMYPSGFYYVVSAKHNDLGTSSRTTVYRSTGGGGEDSDGNSISVTYAPFAYLEDYRIYCKSCEGQVKHSAITISEGGSNYSESMTYLNKLSCDICKWYITDIYNRLVNGNYVPWVGEVIPSERDLVMSPTVTNLCYVQHVVRDGTIYRLNCGLDGVLEIVKETCSTCNGTGKVSNATCTKCSGNKTVPVSICNKVVAAIVPKK